jgi:carbamoylphosphate synthase large subunit
MTNNTKRAKKLLMLGAGVYQIPGIKKASEQNIEVIACSYLPDDPGICYAKYFENVDITDKEGILEVAKKYDIDGIMTVCSDVGVPTVGYVNDKLNLAGISEQTGKLCSDKWLMKKAFQKHHVRSPSFFVIDSLEKAYESLEYLGGNVIFKSTDSSGSRGIIKVDKEQDVPRAFKESFKYTKKDYIIAEEIIYGEEFGSQTLVLNGEVIFNFCHNDVITSGEITTPIGHSYPFRGGLHIEQMALDEVRKAVKALKISDAQLNCDFILSNNKVYVLEIGARVGATSLPQLTENYTGLDWIKIAIDLALGQPPLEKINNHKLRNIPTASTLIYSNTDGVLERIVMPEWLESNGSVTYHTIDVKKGDRVKRFRLGPDRIGEIVFVGETLDKAEAKVERFLEGVTIKLV